MSAFVFLLQTGFIKSSNTAIPINFLICGIAAFSVRPVIQYTNPRVSTIVGRTVKMQCTVLQGNPWPRIMWIKDGELAGNHERIEDDGNGNMIIHNVQVEDEGEFVCLATNVGGNATYVTKLDVQGGRPRVHMSLSSCALSVDRCVKKNKGYNGFTPIFLML